MKNVKLSDIQRSWHLLSAKDQPLGRLSSKVAVILMGKNKSYYTPHLDSGDYVVIIDAQEVILTGKKESQKKYYKHSGYPGGLYVKTASQIRKENAQNLIRHAISGMLPKTKLGKLILKKLFIYNTSIHPHHDKFKV